MVDKRKLIEIWKEKNPRIALYKANDKKLDLYFDKKLMCSEVERKIQRIDLEQIASVSNKNSILEVGLGMAISCRMVDEMYSFAKHVIIEPYQEIIDGCKRNGWFNDGWIILKMTYEEYLNSDPIDKFDVIYFDSADPLDNIKYEDKFANMLEPGGKLIMMSEPHRTITNKS